MIRHFLDISALSAKEARSIIQAAKRMKLHGHEALLQGKTLAMIFERPSTRTRVSFDLAIHQLGGHPLMLTGQEMQLGRGETIGDTARVLSRFVQAIMIRILDHAALEELAAHASVPVINGLTRQSHPCQVMADILTFEEKRGAITGKTVAWVGDSNNVMASWVHASHVFDCRLKIATPRELSPEPALLEWARTVNAQVETGEDPAWAAEGADCIITDTWVSMGDRQAERRHALLRPYQVNRALMARAQPEALFMHCLPAHRGEEVTDEVMDGPQSVVFEEAENRLHAQKAILAWCFDRLPG